MMENKFMKKHLCDGDCLISKDQSVGLCMKSMDCILYHDTDEFLDINEFDEYLKHKGKYDIVSVYRDDELIASSNENGDLLWMKEVEEQTKDETMIKVLTQAYYGNRTLVVTSKDAIDDLILGQAYKMVMKNECVDRTIVPIPNCKHLVLIYNKYLEERQLRTNKEWYEEDGYEVKPLAIIPELDLKIYSRCIVCRINENNELESIQDEDYQDVMKYLAK